MLTLLGLLVIISSLVAWHFMNALWLRPRKLEKSLRDQGFQGNPYRSINGDLVEINDLAKSSLSKPVSPLSHDIVPRIMPFVYRTIKQYGMKSFIWYGRRPRIIVMQPELIKEIFTKYEVFHKECPEGRGKFGLVMRECEDWAKIRRILNPVFHVEKLKKMLPIMENSCETMLRKWEDMVEEKGSGEVDVWTSLSNMSADVIARAAFGTSYEQGKRLFKLQDKEADLTFQLLRSISNYIPGWRYLTKVNRRKKEVEKEIRDIVKNLIEKRKESLKTGNYKYKDDLLGIMLESNEKEREEHGTGMTMEDVIEECKLFHLAGEDTTAALITWAMVLLSQHQDWQTKAREEILQRFGKDKTIDFEDLNHLKIVTMIVNETLRFYPPVTSLSRMIHQNNNLKKLPLLCGTELSLPTILVHRDREIWGDDADKFNPGRFSEGVSNAAKVSGSFFFPFGGGPRVCIGQNFAQVEAKLALAKILQRFSFELSLSYVHAPKALISLEPQFGAPLILYKI